MRTEPRLDIIGAALANPSRCRILCELMDGRAFTNKELAAAAGIAPQTATAHLRMLETAGLTKSLRSGRHIYHRLAGEEVAAVLESLAGLCPTDHICRGGNSRDRRASAVLVARSCYNHIAGRVGVQMTERMLASEVIVLRGGVVATGPNYRRFCRNLGIEPLVVTATSPIAKLCLDWTERQHHISGRLGTAIMQRFLQAGWMARQTGSRALQFTQEGRASLIHNFGLEIEK